MKKILSVFLMLLISWSMPFMIFGSTQTVNASYSRIDIQTWIENEYNSLLAEDNKLVRVDRTAGTEGELNTANYLATKLQSFGYEGRLESFKFTSKITNLSANSQNVIFVKKGSDSTKKVVVCTHYDNSFGFYSSSEVLNNIGADCESANIMTVLSIAYQLKDEILPFDVEFVFFGAGLHSNSGAEYYTLGIDKKQAKNILLAIEIQSLSDNDLYYYDEEISSEHGEFIQKQFDIENTDIERYKSGLSLINESNIEYAYSHAGLMGAVPNLLYSKVRSVSVFSAEKNGHLSSEYIGKTTNNKFMGEASPKVLKRSTIVSCILSNTICNDKFESTMKDSSVANYSFWTNDYLPIYLIVVVFIVGFVLYAVWYIKMYKQFKLKFDKNPSLDDVLKQIDKKIEDSSDPNLIKNKGQIKNMFKEDIENKRDVEVPKDDRDSSEDDSDDDL